MTIRRAIASTLAVLAGAGVLVSAPTMAQAAPAAEVATPSPRTAPSVTWQWSWSDGGTQHRRAFSKRVYGSASNLPYLVVTNDSCAAGILIKLQFRENGRYYTEDRATTRGCKAKVNSRQSFATGNFAIERACHEEQMARVLKGERVVIAWMEETDGSWRANWVERLPILRDLSAQRHAAAGSHTPFLLIDKRQVPPLGEFLRGPAAG